jgi:hypothetical protein
MATEVVLLRLDSETWTRSWHLARWLQSLKKRNNGKSGELDNDRIIDNFYPASVKAIASPRVE